MMLASGAAPVGAVMKPPASMMRSNAARSTIRSLMIGKASARHGSTVIVSPDVELAHVELARGRAALRARGPAPSIISEHVPQMPSRQSWSKVIGSSPCSLSCSLSRSSISRNDASSLMPGHRVGLEAPGVVRAGPGATPSAVTSRVFIYL